MLSVPSHVFSAEFDELFFTELNKIDMMAIIQNPYLLDTLPFSNQSTCSKFNLSKYFFQRQSISRQKLKEQNKKHIPGQTCQYLLYVDRVTTERPGLWANSRARFHQRNCLFIMNGLFLYPPLEF